MCNVHTAHPLSRNPGIPQGLISGISQGLTVEPGIPQGFMFLRLEFLRGSGFSSWNSSEVQVFEAGIPQGLGFSGWNSSGMYTSRTCILDRGGGTDIKRDSPICNAKSFKYAQVTHLMASPVPKSQATFVGIQ